MPLDELTEVSTDVIQRLRYISGQFNISRQITSITPMLLDGSRGDITVRNIRKSSMRNIAIPNYAIPTAITLNDIEVISALPTNFSTPIHTEVMFDELEAHLESDHKKSILYSAIAVESFTSSELDRRYQSKINQALPSLSMKMIELRISSKAKVHKDPIYEFIRDHRRFRNVLHEQSLYVMGNLF